MDVRANQDSCDGVADDDGQADPGGDCGADETDRGDDAHIEHDRRRLNHALAGPGRGPVRASPLASGARESSVPSRKDASRLSLQIAAVNAECPRGVVDCMGIPEESLSDRVVREGGAQGARRSTGHGYSGTPGSSLISSQPSGTRNGTRLDVSCAPKDLRWRSA